jgi:hypothetical protein
MQMTDVIDRKTTAKTTSMEADLNRDPPITGTLGAHPLGTGAGAASGGVAGAAIGMAGGPVGMVVGAAVGAVAGGLAGKGLAEAVNPTIEEAYWKDAYVREPYYSGGRPYDFYAPAYRTGWEGRARFDGQNFDDVEADLQADYERSLPNEGLKWNEGRMAARAAWDRIDQIRTTSR